MQNRENRFCPICNKEIEAEICYEIIMCLVSGFKPSSVPEVEFDNSEKNREICENCSYSNID
jgi:ribosomal protein S27AE